VHASTLLKVIAHEIRNPISTFRGLLQIIDIKSGTPEISKYVEIGLNEIKKVSLLLDEFNQLGKIADINLEKTDMNALMDDVFTLITAGFNDPDIEIVSSFSAAAPVMADKRQLTQAIFNLVKNAYEALNRRGNITLCLNQYDRDWVEIKVSDNGPGISENIKDKLFKPYFSTKADGTGLGLAIANTIVHNHSGKITVVNQACGGACFSIHLPSYAEEANKPESADILIVTDDDLLRLPSERVLKEENIVFYTINKRDSVFRIIEKYRPHAVLFDDNYLNVNILSKLIHNILSDYPDIRILITGDKLDIENEKVRYIPKPLNYAKLVGTIRSVLSEIRL
jgi:two-component sensor histidine kinase